MIVYLTANSNKQLRKLLIWGAKYIAINFDSIVRQREKIPITKLLKKHADSVTWAIYSKGEQKGFPGYARVDRRYRL